MKLISSSVIACYLLFNWKWLAIAKANGSIVVTESWLYDFLTTNNMICVVTVGNTHIESYSIIHI